MIKESAEQCQPLVTTRYQPFKAARQHHPLLTRLLMIKKIAEHQPPVTTRYQPFKVAHQRQERRCKFLRIIEKLQSFSKLQTKMR
ncbi:hypothetical protein NC651_002181 [Populus alba x Populus x berolinensis]|nr:hypothetical protein NC651_002181 [Populus alba x Populus x berolinensis]